MDAALDTVFLYSIEPQVKHAHGVPGVEASTCRSTAKLSCGLPTTKPGQALHVTRWHMRTLDEEIARCLNAGKSCFMTRPMPGKSPRLTSSSSLRSSADAAEFNR